MTDVKKYLPSEERQFEALKHTLKFLEMVSLGRLYRACPERRAAGYQAMVDEARTTLKECARILNDDGVRT